MSIKQIIIKNFRSIENMELDFTKDKSITCFLGKNGVGKSNVFLALKYFYDNLDGICVEDIIDKQNPYNRYCEISIVYDLREFDVKISNDYLRVFFNQLCDQSKECKCSEEPLTNIKKNLIKVNFRQDKEGVIVWNQTKEIRKRIKKIFPFYYINTRQLDLITWEKIWGIIGDLATDMPGKTETEINEKLDSVFSEIYSKFDASKKIVEKTFEENSISLDKYHFESRFKYMFMTRFNGEYFISDGHSLDYYSDGLNSFTYIKLLISLINQISTVSCKSPIIVLDEPEIGLHEAKIEELIRSICESITNFSFLLINTHSPKIICEMIQNELDIDIYRLYLYQLHTKCKKLNTRFLTEQRHIITTLETSCYFSEFIIFVEGESEYQLLNDKYLKELFPFLKEVKVYSFNSNREKLKLVFPKHINIGIPYMVLIDIDKIVQFNKIKNENFYKAKITSDGINPLKESTFSADCLLRFFNSQKTDLKLKLYSKLKGLLNTEFNYKNGCNYVEQNEYIQIVQTIQSLCKFDNYLINGTTLEGELVCFNNVDIFLDFCSGYFKKEKVINKLKSIPDIKERVSLTRLCLDGRLDLGNKEIACQSNGFKQKQKIVDSKADGWINNWIEYLWKNHLADADDKLECFKKFFPSLYTTLQHIEGML